MIGKRSVVVMTVPLTATPICRLLTLGKRPPWKAYRHSIVYRPLAGTTTLLNVMLPRVEYAMSTTCWPGESEPDEPRFWGNQPVSVWNQSSPPNMAFSP